MSTRSKVITVGAASFTAGTVCGLWISATAIGVVVLNNKEASKRFIEEAVHKFIYGDKGLRSYGGPPRSIRYNEPRKNNPPEQLRYNTPVESGNNPA